MPKVPGPTLKANQAVVPTSAATRGVADFRNSSTLISLPGRALSVARIPTLFMRYLLSALRFSSFRKVTVEAANADCGEQGCKGARKDSFTSEHTFPVGPILILVILKRVSWSAGLRSAETVAHRPELAWRNLLRRQICRQTNWKRP